jgi:hypothetical protein
MGRRFVHSVQWLAAADLRQTILRMARDTPEASQNAT